ncbi:MAG: hypothetical protein SOT13_05640 [Candidatus Aphodousia sp.]|nr:hypothetical protein [Sutterella sp.]MDY2899990.1 hypothetical protein [Candidatus Aphodousia sp.]
MAEQETPVVDAQQGQETNAQQGAQQNVWVCDPVGVTHCDVGDKGITYTVTWVDFMGLQHSAQIKREDCFFNFAQVLKTLVRGGYRYNTMITQAPAIIQQRLTSFRPSEESVKNALKAVKK